MSHASIFDVLDGGELKPAWVEFRDGWEFQLEASTAEEQRRVMTPRAGKSAISEAQRRDYWLGKVKGWRGAVKGGQEFAMSPERLRRLWDIDPTFVGWLVEECQRLEHFC